ncbi:XRE family transcriptional regulator [Apilactobacillus sp. M161]|uniref:XRE family transcriptional regulator n=1 Tax=Apilactobacillus xinyiensis TaxID=2841032 RepID=A0ABT0I1D1_9LACO|nr:XRE family transcriptional regulator [Apilactobacillus xinyiensis]MCK8624527.1 XRE family transcriptional regulator [Apilactobacillus xinyiensis]
MKNIFNHQLINLRRQKQLSQNDLANKIYVSRQAISKWENGDAEPSLEKLINLTEIFNTSLDFLILGHDDKNEKIIEIHDLKKAFDKPVLNGVDLDAYSHDRIALLGSNGAGKTTLFNLIVGLTSKDSGTINSYINNRKDLSIMAQENLLIDNLKVIEQLELSASMYEVEISQLDNLMKQFNLYAYKNNYVASLSGGQKRKLSLLMSVMRPSKLLLLDEPTVGMDLKSIDFFWKYMDHIGGSIITITHDFNQIDKFFSKVILMKNGKIFKNVAVNDIHSHNQTIEQWYRYFNDEV